ncbi:MaoC family dehydratase [Paenibacillus gallinarum]|uniref:MaoC family dehydratase N-terminal domain-containing protein n=1 Tax=Paenibacillus gallinarum TaxID=2762232 RepID=A0ABR8SYD0_9BACL|nr:MaoC/PaaZ C-terminal domain-containing protein [Paenibacillus gallinarum]MBD7968508.1 MaoC family dehydratase N-terminal domain-containing protein [Paenibacillus gallinarum]
MKKRITADHIQQYAAASKDRAAIHLNAEAAARAGYKRPIVHGMYIMGIAQSLYLAEHPAQWIKTCNMKFINPLLTDAVASFHFEVCVDQIDITVTAETGEVIAKGTFSVEERF